MAVDQEEIHRLSLSENVEDRLEAARLLRDNFGSLPDQETAWSDFHRLTFDKEWKVTSDTASAIGYVFSFIPEIYKYAAWSDLQRLTLDVDSSVRNEAASAIGSAFEHIPDECKSAVWSHLIMFANDEDSYVKMYANYSLGKICIFKASKSEHESDSKALLGDAIQYFEKAANEHHSYNPAKFCNLFYRSFDAVIFKKVSSMKEIEDYISNAKKEIAGSESKQRLIEVVEKLAEVLETAQNSRKNGIDHQELLKHCSDICNHVDLLMDENKDKTPVICGLYGKFRPSFRRTIKELIDEVKEKAEAACREARGTDAEPIACSINKEIRGWHVENQEQMAKKIENLTSSLKLQIPNLPANAFIHSKIDEIKSCQVVEDQFEMLTTIVSLLPTISIQKDISDIKKDTTEIRKTSRQVSTRLQKIHNILDTPGGKIGTALTVGGFFTTAFLLLFSSDPNIGYMAVIFGSLIAIAFYLFS